MTDFAATVPDPDGDRALARLYTRVYLSRDIYVMDPPPEVIE